MLSDIADFKVTASKKIKIERMGPLELRGESEVSHPFHMRCIFSAD